MVDEVRKQPILQVAERAWDIHMTTLYPHADGLLGSSKAVDDGGDECIEVELEVVTGELLARP
jgi:hypothetical protein